MRVTYTSLAENKMELQEVLSTLSNMILNADNEEERQALNVAYNNVCELADANDYPKECKWSRKNKDACMACPEEVQMRCPTPPPRDGMMMVSSK